MSTVMRAGVLAATYPTPALAELAIQLAPNTSSGTRLGTVPFAGEGAAANGEATGADVDAGGDASGRRVRLAEPVHRR